MKKKPTSDALDQAKDFVDTSRQLNYRRIAAHEQGAVTRLNKAVKQLDIPRAKIRRESSDTRLALKSAGSGFDIWTSRLSSIRDVLDEHGFRDRLDRLFSSVDNCLMGIELVPHRRGLPNYDLLVAPDYAPVAGLHGIFIVGNTVRAYILPQECLDVGAWRLLQQRSFDSVWKMVEWVEQFAHGQEPAGE